MREIKFRAWDTIELIYDFDIMSREKHKSEQFGKYRNGFEIPIMSDECIMHVMQYTGLKDKNGKEIYEGDIIQNYAFRGTVIFHNGIFTTNMSAEDNFNTRQSIFVHNELEVIGNIYENKELLK